MFPLQQQPPPPGPLTPGPGPLGATTPHLSFSRQHRNVNIRNDAPPVVATLPSYHRVRIGTVSGLRRRLGSEAAASADIRPDYFVDPRVDTELHDTLDAEDTLEPQPFETFPYVVDVDPPAPAGTVISVTMAPASQPTSTPQPTSPTSASPMSQQTDNNTECRLLGSFAILVQIALGCLAISSLVYKRWRERPQRPVKIWFFDVSKQVFGSVLVHAANVFMSMLTSGKFEIKVVDPVAAAVGTKMVKRAVEYGILSARGGSEDEYTPNPCSFYLLNLAIDTTLGIPILILLVRLISRGLTYTRLGQPPESLQSGNYTPLDSPSGTKPRWGWWFKQSIIYFIGLLGMKFFVLIIFMVFPWISRIGDWALGWTEGNERLQIAFVMMIFPLIMNALQYYIIDSYIKKQEQIPEDGAESEGLVTGRGDAEAANPHQERDGRGSVYSVISGSEAGSSSGDDSDDEGELPRDKVTKDGGKSGKSGKGVKGGVKTKVRETPAGEEEYDPAVDGDTPTVIGSSSSAVSGLTGGSIREERLKESDSLISHD